MRQYSEFINEKIDELHQDILNTLDSHILFDEDYIINVRLVSMVDSKRFVIRLYKLKEYYNKDKDLDMQLDQTILKKTIISKWSKDYNKDRLFNLLKDSNFDKYIKYEW
jgi:hypothetical protein